MVEDNKKFKKKTHGILSKIIIAICSLAIGFAAGVYASVYLVASDVDPVRQGKTEININVIESEVEEISELATYKYWYRNINTYDEGNKEIFDLVEVPLTSKFLAVQYEGVVKIGSDLSEKDIRVKDNKISITLPHAKILSHTIDKNSWKKVHEDSTILNPIEVEDGNRLEKDGMKEIEEYLIGKGAIEEAEKSIKRQMIDMIKSIYPEAKVTVEFK